METWLVTGASGFLGANAGVFLREKARAVGTSRHANAYAFEEFVTTDLTSNYDVRELVLKIRPDVILHTAALSSHEACEMNKSLAFDMNAIASQMIAQLAAEMGAKLIYISTDAVFDGIDGNYTESDDPSPFSTYGESKLMGEMYVQQECPDALIIRTNFFGWSPTKDRSILEFFINSLRAGKKVLGFTDFIVSSIYVEELLDFIWKLRHIPVSGVVNVASRDKLSKFEFGKCVADTYSLDSRLISPASAAGKILGIDRVRDLSLKTDYLQNVTKAFPQTQLEGIAQSFRSNPLAQ